MYAPFLLFFNKDIILIRIILFKVFFVIINQSITIIISLFQIL